MIIDRSILRIGDGASRIQHVFADKYYDGPERGVAIFTGGLGFAFEVIGESVSRLYRCFAFSDIGESYSKFDVRTFGVNDSLSGGYIKFIDMKSSNNEYHDALSRTSDFKFIAAGSPGLDCLEIARLNQEEVSNIKNQKSWVETFRVSHSILKKRRSISS
ncbi:MAG: hypothetical protein V4610_07650 [Pseudomonadota bacterium]|jgi:hypothetical protein